MSTEVVDITGDDEPENPVQDNSNKLQGNKRGGFQQRRRGISRRGRGAPNRGGPPQRRQYARNNWRDETQLFDNVMEKLSRMSGPTYDLPPIEQTEKKFSGKNRLYVGNLPQNTTKDDLIELFIQFGEVDDIFLNGEKNFAFVQMDFHKSTVDAKETLDSKPFKGRRLKVRIAPVMSTLKVKNLTHFVSNELLFHSFSIFGEVEKAIILVDDRGKHTGEGLVEFMHKSSANKAMRRCNEGCFFLTGSLRPCVVELYENNYDLDGCPERAMSKNNDFYKARSLGPRFPNSDSFEHHYGNRWKCLYEIYTQKVQAIKQELEFEKEKLEAQIEFGRYEFETHILREELRRREVVRERQQSDWVRDDFELPREQRFDDNRPTNNNDNSNANFGGLVFQPPRQDNRFNNDNSNENQAGTSNNNNNNNTNKNDSSILEPKTIMGILNKKRFTMESGRVWNGFQVKRRRL